MSERETDEYPSHELVTRQTPEETTTAAIRDLLIGREVFRREFSALREKAAALVKRHKGFVEETASTDAKMAAWAEASTALVEDSEYWESKMATLTEGQENIKHESVTIEILQGLIASTNEKLIAQLETIAPLKEKQASLRKIREEIDSEAARLQAVLGAVKKQIYRLEEKLIKTLSPKPGDAQEPSATGHD
ncbi:hypothetical protein FIE12Z_5244 [Fusarium flagelliforme]|uniref:Uncharacterized protein n=1 Tax=Fusarium flagelliforme TaxID=2675880 RepID=A0A395MRA4_9HYPO|nr:hypothetical protein FIE12Z_5244 [Fusarium flagelliforme]